MIMKTKKEIEAIMNDVEKIFDGFEVKYGDFGVRGDDDVPVLCKTSFIYNGDDFAGRVDYLPSFGVYVADKKYEELFRKAEERGSLGEE